MIDEPLHTAPLLHDADAERRVAGDVVALDADESRHVRALRLSAGDPVRLTDARGTLWAGRLEGAGAVRLRERLEPPPALDVELWPAVGNKQAMLWLVEKAAEFGLLRLCPVECERSMSVADAGRSTSFWRKADRRALAAVKQSGSARAPEIDRPRPLAERLEELGRRRASGSAVGRSIVLDAGGPPLLDVLGSPDPAAAAAWPAGSGPTTVLVGPEGGLTDAELEAVVEAGFRPAALASPILRFETAAVAALAVAAQLALRTSDTGVNDDG